MPLAPAVSEPVGVVAGWAAELEITARSFRVAPIGDPLAANPPALEAEELATVELPEGLADDEPVDDELGR